MTSDLADQTETLGPIPDQVGTLSEFLRIGKDEMNLAEFPMTSLSDKPSSDETSLKFEDRIYDDRKRKMIVRKRVIEGSKEYGLPTATDDSVILALVQLTRQKNGFMSREVEFSRRELINLLQWPNKGQSYERIAQALHRVASVTYHFENSWWDNRRKTWTTKIFGIIDTVELNDSRESDQQGGVFASRVFWNQTILDSFQAGYLRSLDFQLAISFKHAISLRIYRFMGKRFHLRPEWLFDIKDFSYEHIGLSRNYEGGTQIARKLKPALIELEQAGFLAPLSDGERFPKNGRNWSILLVRKAEAPFPDQESEAEPEPTTPTQAARLQTDLVNRGVTEATAADLVNRYATEVIESKLDVHDWLVETKDRRVAKSSPGYLVKSIETGYADPVGYVSRAERERRDDARQKTEHEAREASRRKREEETRKRQVADAVTAFRAGCSAERIAQIEGEAIAWASPETRLILKDPKLARTRKPLIHHLINDYLTHRFDSGSLTLGLAQERPAS